MNENFMACFQMECYVVILTLFYMLSIVVLSDICDFYLGEKMTEEEVEMLLAGHEDANGQINYEGENKSLQRISLIWLFTTWHKKF